MIPLATNRRVLAWLCVYYDDEQIEKPEQLMQYRAFALFIFGMNVVGFAVSVAYFVKFVSIDFNDSLFALLQAFGGGNMIYISGITYMSRQKICNIFKTISTIYAERKLAFYKISWPYHSSIPSFFLPL